MKYIVSIYRVDSVTTVEISDVKHVFWTANNTVLTIAQYDKTGEHHYINYLRESICWYKIKRQTRRKTKTK